MKIVSRKEPVAEEAAQEEDTTAKFAGAEARVHRRTTVTVERETLSILMRRTVVEPDGADAAANVGRPAGEESVPEPQDKELTAASPQMEQAQGRQTMIPIETAKAVAVTTPNSSPAAAPNSAKSNQTQTITEG